MCNFASIPLGFSEICSLVSNVFIKIHEYSNKFVFISVHMVRVLCCRYKKLYSRANINRDGSNFTLNFPHFHSFQIFSLKFINIQMR